MAKMPVRGADPMCTRPTSRTKTGTPLVAVTTTFSMSLDRLDEADAAHDQPLLLVVEQRAAGVLVVRIDRLRDVADRQVVFRQRDRIDLDLVLLDRRRQMA